MHRRPRLTLLACLTLAGCSSAVPVAPLPAATATVCRAVPWPSSVGGRPLTETTPADPSVRAWGDPAIVARCGGAALAPTTTQCLDVDGVGWIPQELSDGIRFTTFGTDPTIEVLVPAAYSPEALLLPAFRAAAATLPRNGLECR
ncbi:MAG: hypothetical protein IPL94_04490 [Tetrasphaera sp.]|nr:hypothetical protein [Tetrasphaera sp.]